MNIKTKRNINDVVKIFNNANEWIITNIKIDVYINEDGETVVDESYSIESEEVYIHDVAEKDIETTY